VLVCIPNRIAAHHRGQPPRESGKGLEYLVFGAIKEWGCNRMTGELD
jgi:hypothetical protein